MRVWVVRHMGRGLELGVIGLTLTVVGSLSAQDGPAPVVTDAQQPAPPPPKPAPPPWTVFTADLGVVNTAGNSNVTTANVSNAFSVWTDHSNKLSQTFGLVYGTNNGKVQTNLWTAGLRDSYILSQVVGLYGLFAFDRNTFAGIEQRFEEGLGASLVPVNKGRNRLEFDLGGSYIQQRTTAGVETDYGAGRAGLIYRYTFAKESYFQEAVDDLADFTNFSNYRINSQTDFVAPLSKHVALKVGYQVRYSNQPPPGFKTTDRFLTTDLQFNF